MKKPDFGAGLFKVNGVVSQEFLKCPSVHEIKRACIFSSPGQSPGRAIVLPLALASALAFALASALLLHCCFTSTVNI